MNLSKSFSLNEFKDWVENFLPSFQIDIRNVDIPSNFKGINKIITLGESNIGVRVFVIETDQNPTNKKISMAKESFNLIKNYGTSNALIVYYSSKFVVWRISLLTSKPEWANNKIILKLSNTKRQSYVVGEKVKTATPSKFLLALGKVGTLKELKERFSLEVVNREFYDEISKSFTYLVGGKRKMGRKYLEQNPLIILPLNSEQHQKQLEFGVRLIGRIIFCWFLKEKKSEQGIPLMPKELISKDATKNYENYYHSVLEPIFFQILNKTENSRREEYCIEPFSIIPYLNGGLFSPQEDDFYSYINTKQELNNSKVFIPNIWFTSLFEILETYNFTIDENTSYDEEISIDPEMLGRIFENLLAEINPETGESARKNTGSFYTPRNIVEYMIDESLFLYLKQKTEISDEKIHALLSYDLYDDIEFPLTEVEKVLIVNQLFNVKILDPACGSGAFPIGILQKLVFILQQVDNLGKNWYENQIKNAPLEIKRVLEREYKEKNFDYIRKLGIIRDNIFGVDIQPIATEISRLRCFLTLVVDERVVDNLPNRGIEPLPNLDFKFVTANTLFDLPTKNQSSLFEDSQGIEELKEIREMFFNSSGHDREHLKLQFSQVQIQMLTRLVNQSGKGIANITGKLTSWNPFNHKASDWFDMEWMFGVKDGFDIVIANPPYVSFGLRNVQSIEDTLKTYLIKNYPNSAEYKLSIYSIFMDKSIQLSKKEGGIQSLIVPDSFLLGKYFSKIRLNILKNCKIYQISWFPYKIFEATVGYSVVYTFENSVKSDINSMNIRCIRSNEELSENKFIELNYDKNVFYKSENNKFRLFFNKPVMDLILKIEKDSKVLKNFISFKSGLISKNGQENIKATSKLSEVWKPGITSGGEVKKFTVSYKGQFIKYDKSAIKSGYESVDYFSPKVFLRQTGDSITCAYDKTGLLALNNVHIGNKINELIDIRVITAILNSDLINWYYKNTSLEEGRAMAQIDIDALDLIPIAEPRKTHEEIIINLVEKISISSNNQIESEANKDLEAEINKEVFKLYKLNLEDINLIKEML